MTNSTKLPVLLLTYRKEEFLDEILTVISEYEPSVLYVFHNLEKDHLEKDLVLNVKSKIDSFEYPHRIVRHQHESHLDINTSIKTAIDTVFEIEEKLIIIEDDIIPNQSFFTFCEKMIEKYDNSTEIGCINGCNLNALNEDSAYYFSSLSLPYWGWATWKSTWQKYREDAYYWNEFSSQIIQKINQKDRKFFQHFFEQCAQGNSSWDIQWNWTLMANQLRVIIPGVNLIENKGYSPLGTYTNFRDSKFSEMIKREIDVSRLNLNRDAINEYEHCVQQLIAEIMDNLESLKPNVSLKIIGIFKLTQQIDRTPWLDQNIKVWFQDISKTKWRKIDDIKKLYSDATVFENMILFPIKDYQIVTKFNDETCQLLILDVIRQEELDMYSIEKSELGLTRWIKSLFFKKEKNSYLAFERKLKRLGSIFLFSANSKEGIEASSLISQISAYDALKSQIDKPDFIEGLKIRALLK